MFLPVEGKRAPQQGPFFIPDCRGGKAYTGHMKNFLNEFKTFALRGNVMDLAVGVMIGAALNQVTTSLVTNVLTPPIGLLLGGLDFSTLAIPLGGESVIAYGLFLQALFNFLIVALVLFLLIKVINRFAAQAKKEEPKPVEDSQLQVLKEIRDLLVQRGA